VIGAQSIREPWECARLTTSHCSRPSGRWKRACIIIETYICISKSMLRPWIDKFDQCDTIKQDRLILTQRNFLFLLFSSFVISSNIAAVPWSLTHFTTKFVYSDERSQVELFIHFYNLRVLLQIHYSVCHFSPKIRLSATRLRRCCQVLDSGFENSFLGAIVRR